MTSYTSLTLISVHNILEWRELLSISCNLFQMRMSAYGKASHTENLSEVQASH